VPKIIVEGDGVFFAASGERLTAGEYETTDPALIASALAVDLDWVHVIGNDGLTVTEVPEAPAEPPVTAKVAEVLKPDLTGPLTAADFGAAEKKAAAANDDRPPRPAPPPEVKK
jgi:hypothetical protein